MELATTEDTNYIQVRNPEDGRSDGSSLETPPEETQSTSLSFASHLKILCVGLIAASPVFLLIVLGAKPSVASLGVYVGLLVSPSIFVQFELQSGVVRWFLGFIILFLTSAWKSGQLLASCDTIFIKGVLYAITALWECSNAVLVIGGSDLAKRYGISSPKDVILYCLAPCQVKFVRTETRSQNNLLQNWLPPVTQLGKRSIHILLCSCGALGLYYFIQNDVVRTIFTSFILLELEYIALMASMAVVILDVPSHLWQLIYNTLDEVPIIHESTMTPSTAHVILPYGWVYSLTSTRVFWSRWSRPATQLLRHLFYHPLGGRDRWYISIPVMFLLNASSHFDLSYALVGERSEVYWLALFGTLALVAMLEVVGDQFFGHVNSEGNTDFPKWYWYARAFVAHVSLRAVLYIMVHLCLKSSLSDLVGPGNI